MVRMKKTKATRVPRIAIAIMAAGKGLVSSPSIQRAARARESRCCPCDLRRDASRTRERRYAIIGHEASACGRPSRQPESTSSCSNHSEVPGMLLWLHVRLSSLTITSLFSLASSADHGANHLPLARPSSRPEFRNDPVNRGSAIFHGTGGSFERKRRGPCRCGGKIR